MSLVPHRYERVAKVSRQQAPDAAIHEVNTIGSREMDSRADTYCDGKNWRLLSTRGQLCDVKVFHNSYEAITNVPVGRSVTAVVHGDGTVYILILNETLSFGKPMDPSLINPHQIRSFGIPVSDNPFDRTW